MEGKRSACAELEGGICRIGIEMYLINIREVLNSFPSGLNAIYLHLLNE